MKKLLEENIKQKVEDDYSPIDNEVLRALLSASKLDCKDNETALTTMRHLTAEIHELIYVCIKLYPDYFEKLG